MKDAPRLSRLRFALLVVIGVYPLITAILYGLGPLTSGWAVWQRTLVITPLMVAAITWGVIPIIHRAFHGFIHPARCSQSRQCA